MARKKKKTEDERSFERIEIVVPLGFTQKLDRVAEALGLNRSSFIRMAAADRIRQEIQRLGLDSEGREV
jgi:hypothetical protein